jgi:hypothetical protein
MLRGFDIAANKVSAAPLPVRAANAATSVSGASDRANPVIASAASGPSGEGRPEPRVFRYNSFEFRYRQDVGRIVLIGQSPETRRVVQVPSEQALRVYAQRARAEKLQDNAQLLRVDIQVTGSAPEPLQSLPSFSLGSAPGQTVFTQPAQAVDITI